MPVAPSVKPYMIFSPASSSTAAATRRHQRRPTKRPRNILIVPGLLTILFMAGWGSLLGRASLVSANKRPLAFATPLFRRSKPQASRLSSAFATTTSLPITTRQLYHPFQLQATATAASRSSKRTKTTTAKPPSGSRPYRLVIVESPSKCATIEKILQKYVEEHQLDYDFVVTSCYGHIRNLPKNKQEIRDAKYLSAPPPTPESTSAATEFPYSIVGVDLEQDYQPTYVLLPGKEKLVQELQDLTSAAQHVYLATDPDREGEAIAWHLQQVLELDNTKSERLSFTEITPTAIQAAVESPHSLNERLVAAQETRRILDRLAGFTVSPVLWKKIAPGLSAGRVQSVGMALVVQRERERLIFTPAEYWDVQGNFSNVDCKDENDFISATLVSINKTSLVAGKSDFIEANNDTETIAKVNGKLPRPQPKPNKRLLTEKDARELVAMLEDPNTQWQVKSVTARERLSYPPEPFKTSTLQQESNQRLGMSVSQTMSTAQQLYEAGWISYMRTDATHLSEDASAATAAAITKTHGPDYVAALSSSPKKRSKKKKKDSASDKVAQEAHEAIRPAIQPSGNFANPQEITSSLPDSVKSLYELIYRRTLASRMPPQKTDQTTVVFEGTSGDTTTTVEFRTTGSVVLEPGFTLEWNRGDSSYKYLPPLEEGQELSCHDLDPLSHTTQPPPRYTEASLVKELEALGVGRPSTYAGIVRILRDRAYVGSPTSSSESSSSRDHRKTAATGAAITAQRAAGGGDLFGARGPLAPSLSAFVVTSLLEEHCPTYVDPSFTARMEENLDRIARGNYRHDNEDFDEVEDEADAPDVAEQRIAYLNEFYAGEQGLAAQIKRIDDTVDAETARRANLPALEPSEDEPDVGIYIGPWGPYIQQKAPGKDQKEEILKAPLPAGLATDLSSISLDALKALVEAKQTNGTVLGQHPEDGRNIRLKVGRFGAYLQWGESDEEGTTTHSLPKKLSAMQDLQTDRNAHSDTEHDDMPNDSAQEHITDASSLSGMLGITLEEAIGYTGLPRTVTTLEDKPIIASIGPYGPYLKYNNSFMTLNARDGDVLTIDEEVAKQLVIDGIVNKKPGKRGVLAELGEKDGSMVTVKSGRFGPYIQWKKVNARLPSEFMDEPDTMPLEDAWVLIQDKAGSASTNSKKKSSKKSDLPPPPKRPVSAYLHFCAEKRPEVSKEVKTLGEVSKKLASMWAETTDEDRKAYHELARVGKDEYQKEKAGWDEDCKKLQKTVGGRKKQASVDPSLPSQPKRPKSAYLFFCETKRPEVSQKGLGLGEVTKELARMWADTEDRTEYTALAEADKARYEEEKAQSSHSSPASKVQRSSAKRKKSPSTRKQNGTEKRAPSAYIIFCRETRGEIVDENGDKLPLGETTKRLADRWNNLDPAQKAKWSERAIEEKEKLLV